MVKKREKLYLVDGSSYIYRAYYAIRPLSTSKGLPTNALYGFTRMLLKLLKDERPDKIAVVFDTEEPTFRDEIYKEYKANRSAPPDDLIPQFPYFEPIVQALNIKEISMPGYEADDVIGTVAGKAVVGGYDVVIITGDKDFMQLVGENIRLFDTMKERWIDREEVEVKFGVEPEKVIDVMSLTGDSSDNIPGVRGIGDKTAVNLIKQYGSLDNLISNVEKISNVKVRAALKEGLEDARLSRTLVTIRHDVPLEFDWDEFGIQEPDSQRLEKLFSELEFFKLLRELLPLKMENSSVEDFRIESGDLKILTEELGPVDSVAMFFIEDDVGFSFVGLGISWGGEKAAYIPISHDTLEDIANVDGASLKSFLGALGGKKIFIHNAKVVLRKLRGVGIYLDGVSDVGLMSYVLNQSSPADLVLLGQQILGIHFPEAKSQKAEGGKKMRGAIPLRDAAAKARRFAGVTFQLAGKFVKELAQNKLLNRLFVEVEMPLMMVLLKMEERGIVIDVDKFKLLSKEYNHKISDLEEKIYSEAGEKFTINSPKQLSYILFEKQKLPAIKKTKTGYSTDSSVLSELALSYKLPALVLEYRTHSKLKSTYIDVLPTLADKDGRIHTTFNQAVTATGRLSSSDPNLQNVPARTEEGRRIREAFVTRRGFKLISADYSQIELRILAHISGDGALIDAFEKGIDVHTATAAKVFGIDEGKVSEEMRSLAKTVNFGVLYGQGAYGLSQQLDISVDEADEYIKNYYKSYPKVKELKEKILDGAAKNGFVETVFGRRRYIPDINSQNKGVKAFAERTAFNAVFQGTAADIIKMAMLELDNTLQKDFPDAAMLLQVHDELVFEAPLAQVEPLCDVIRKKMCDVTKLRVPMEVDIGVGNNWAECM